jgi:hypothetical protein
MAQFSDLLNDMRGWESVLKKRRSLRGLKELLTVGRSHIRPALPQVIVLSVSALTDPDSLDMRLLAIRSLARGYSVRCFLCLGCDDTKSRR